MHADGERLNDLSGRVIGCALAHKMRASGLSIAQQCGVKVHYNRVVVGEYFADLLVEDVLLVELKVCGYVCCSIRHGAPGDQTRG